MKKRLVSILLTLTMCMGLAVPAFAADDPDKSGTDYDNTVMIPFEGKTIEIRNYRIEDAHIVYAEIDGDIMFVQNNVVFLNDVKIATITISVDNNAIEPRTGWIYSESCPAGTTSSAYNTLVQTRKRDITFEESIEKYSVGAILAALISVFPFASQVKAEEFFRNVALTIAGMAAGDTIFGKSNHVYATEYIYSGEIPYSHKNILHYHKYEDGTEKYWTEVLFSAWA